MTDSTENSTGKEAPASVPVVAIGASAGGLEALRQLFATLPADTGMAFVVIQHLDPSHPSMLASVLATDTAMPVVEITDGMRAEPNRVHVIPPGSDLAIHRGRLALVPRNQTRKLHLPIDAFLASLAAELPDAVASPVASHERDAGPGRAIGVVLSGSASDGTEGLRALKAAGGITIAQDPESAQFRSMPDSAISAGVVDLRLAPDDIARELVRLARDPYLAAHREPEVEAPGDDAAAVARILDSVRRHAHTDFRGYKRPTILRRVARRMALRRITGLAAYAHALEGDAAEARSLAQDILIHVTAFFRDPEAFESLRRRALPELVQRKGEDDAIRVWVPGCSTGEEAYSLAICLLEVLAEQGRSAPIKIFGSDLSDEAIQHARAGLYSEGEVQGVGKERLARFFEPEEGRYRISRQVRDLCVFVRHDLTRDPPFARLDLVSCRNVLIYFDPELQRRVLALLHHCLNRGGFLFLGSSEAVAGLEHLYSSFDSAHRIFARVGESPRLEFPAAVGREAEPTQAAFLAQPPRPARDVQRQADNLLLSRFAPPGVLVNDAYDVVQFRGQTGDFLAPPPGQPQTNLLKLAREGLVAPLREALEAAKAEAVTVRRQGVRVDDGGRTVDVEVVPFSSGAARYFLVLFEGPSAKPAPAALSADASAPAQEVARLKAELASVRDYLQAITADHQDTTEDLAAANEELVASNEELQSTNEELQSAKEELQSTNEELTTVNDELRNSNGQLDVLANDLVNVLESVQIPVIIVDRDLRVRRFTPTARLVSSLLPGDVGRSIDDVRLKVTVDDLPARIRETVASGVPRELEVQALDGRWFRLHLRPYRTADLQLDGAILSFLDIDALKQAAQEAVRARDFARRIVETVPVPLVVLDRRLRVVSANPPFHRAAFTTAVAVHEQDFFALLHGAVGPLRAKIERTLSVGQAFEGFDLEGGFAEGARRHLRIAGVPVQGEHGDVMALLALEDVTERRLLEASEKRARLDAEQANRAKDLFLATLSHELRTPLGTILLGTQILQRSAPQEPRVAFAATTIERAARNQARLIEDLLDISRIVSGKLMLDVAAVDFAAVVESAVEVARHDARARGVKLEVDVPPLSRTVRGDAVRLQQVVANLLTNALKFTPGGGRISVVLREEGGRAKLIVADTGMGIPAEVLPSLFDRFVQADSAMTRQHGGLGLGLAIVRHLVTVHGGEVTAQSEGPGKGSTFTVVLPLAEKQAVAPTPSRTAVPDVTGVRVLLVDDDDDARAAGAMLLEGMGVVVRAARSAKDALAEVGEFRPEAILCDVAMPGEDGFAFLEKLRARGRERGGDTPTAALTALAGAEDRSRVLRAGFQLHLAKPVDSAALAMAISALVHHGRAATAAPPAEA